MSNRARSLSYKTRLQKSLNQDHSKFPMRGRANDAKAKMAATTAGLSPVPRCSLSSRLRTNSQSGGAVYEESKADDIWHERRVMSERRARSPSSNSSEKFRIGKVKEVISRILSSQLSSIEYNHKLSGEKCRLLSQMIENSVKSLSSKQEKIAAVVYIGALRDEGIVLSSQCQWSAGKDLFTMATFKNQTLFAVGIVFGTLYSDD